MDSNSRPFPLGSDNDRNLSNPSNSHTRTAAHELQLQLGFGGQQQQQNHSHSCINPETVAFLEYPQQATGGSDTNSNRKDLKREKKRQRDLRYRQKEKQNRLQLEEEIQLLRKENAILEQNSLQHKEEIQQLRKENATLEEDLRNYGDKDHMSGEIAGYNEHIHQLETEVVQLKSTLNSQNLVSEVAAGQCAGSKHVDLERRYEGSKREIAVLKKRLKKVKREKKVMEKALLERIMKLEGMEKQDIEPSSSYTDSGHSNM